MNDDIKHALGSVFTDEPPLRVYRDEVLRKGRTRLRQRRLAIAGGFAAVVTAVAFSASLVTGANSAQVEPAGTGPVPGLCSTLSAAPTVTTVQYVPCEPTSQEHAEALTAVLADGNVVPPEFTLRDTNHPLQPGPLAFGQQRSQYTASADLVAADGQEGTMYVMVGGTTSNSARPDCSPRALCESRIINGEDVQITKVSFGSAGENLTIVHLKRADGSQVYASTSNVSVKAMAVGGKAVTAPTIDRQPLTVDQLVKIVTLPGLKF